MPIFKYKCITSTGQTVFGSCEAIDRASAIGIVKEKGLLPLEITLDNNFLGTLKKLNFSKVPIKDISIFCRQFATILTAGVTVLSAIDMLRRQTNNNQLKKAVGIVFDDLQKGHTLSQSMRSREGVFPELLINMIDTGELSGTLDTTMLRMAAHFEKENKVNQKIRAAMTYPIILGVISVLMVVFMVYFILPNFITLIDSSGGEIPALTKNVIAATDFVKNKWYVIIAAALIFVFVFKKTTAKGAGRKAYHTALLKIPVLGNAIKKIVASRFTRTLGIMLSSGVPLISALEATNKVIGNAVAEEGIKNAMTAIKNGQGLAAPLDSAKIFEPIVIQMIQIGEDTGSLDTMLSKTADFFDDEVEASLSQLMTVVEPVMLLLMGGVVATIVIAMLLPMYGMLDTLGG